jgi:hypothetical protein
MTNQTANPNTQTPMINQTPNPKYPNPNEQHSASPPDRFFGVWDLVID